MQFGRLYQAAPELRVRTWIDGSGEPMDTPLRLDDLGSGYKIIFAFQHWCPGCHSSGFPTLQRLYRARKDGGGFGFSAIAISLTPDFILRLLSAYNSTVCG
jgi:hypothetical protein